MPPFLTKPSWIELARVKLENGLFRDVLKIAQHAIINSDRVNIAYLLAAEASWHLGHKKDRVIQNFRNGLGSLKINRSMLARIWLESHGPQALVQSIPFLIEMLSMSIRAPYTFLFLSVTLEKLGRFDLMQANAETFMTRRDCNNIVISELRRALKHLGKEYLFDCVREELKSTLKKSSNNSLTPVFLVGYPKSGTTLLLSLLDSHPQALVYPEETTFFQYWRKRKQEPISFFESLHLFLMQTKCRHLIEGSSINDGGGCRDYSNLDTKLILSNTYRYWARSLSRGDKYPGLLLESAVLGYGLSKGESIARVWVEKTPRNEHFLDLAKNEWSNLKAIYMLRNPLDNYVSYQKKRSKDGFQISISEFANELKKSLSDWEKFSVENPDNALLIRYEDLVSDPKAVMNDVTIFLGLDYDNSLLTPTLGGQFWSGNSQHRKKFSSVTPSSIGIGRAHLDAKSESTLFKEFQKEIEKFYPYYNI